jgi:hypothetical protein
MSSSREEIEPIRAQRTRPTLRPPLPPTVSPSVLVGVGLPVARLAPSRNVPSSSRARRRTRDARMYPYASPLPPPSSRPLSLSLSPSRSLEARPPLPRRIQPARGRFRLLAPDIAGNSSRGFAPGRFINGIITSLPCPLGSTLLERNPRARVLRAAIRVTTYITGFADARFTSRQLDEGDR